MRIPLGNFGQSIAQPAPRLVKSFISWARENGVKPGYVQLIISTGVHVEQTAGLYQALGCRQFSVGFEV